MPRSLPRLTARPGVWLALFAAYFAAQAVLRVTLGDRVNIDEAEALLWAQGLDWGYGPQPPLYIWAQGAVFALTGPGVLGLAVLKALVLWGIAACGFTLARRWAGPGQVAVAGLATLALIWLPELSWESQRIRTHNTLAALIALAAVLALLRLRADPRARQFVALGALFGLGLLAKWNFITLIPALLGALLLAPGGGRVLARPAALWLAVLPAALIAPTGLWMQGHPEIAFASVGKLGLAAEGPAWALWLAAFARNFAEFAGLPLLVLGTFALAGRRAAGLAPEARAEMRIVLRVVAIALALVLIGGLVSGATRMTSRWFLPLVLPAMPVAGVWVAIRLGGRGRLAFAGLAAALAGLLLVAIGAMLTRDPPLPGVPLAEMAAALPETGADAVILAPVALAGNLALMAPDRRVTDAALLLAGPCPAELSILSAGEAPHPGLAPFLARCGLAAMGAARPLLADRPELITRLSR